MRRRPGGREGAEAGNVPSCQGEFWKEARDGPGYSFTAKGGKRFSTRCRTGLIQAETCACAQKGAG